MQFDWIWEHNHRTTHCVNFVLVICEWALRRACLYCNDVDAVRSMYTNKRNDEMEIYGSCIIVEPRNSVPQLRASRETNTPCQSWLMVARDTTDYCGSLVSMVECDKRQQKRRRWHLLPEQRDKEPSITGEQWDWILLVVVYCMSVLRTLVTNVTVC